MNRFYVGLDLGQRVDPSAVALVEFLPQETTRREMVTTRPSDPRLRGSLVRWETIVEEAPPHYHLVDLWRFPLDTRYTHIVRGMKAYLGQPPIKDDVTLVLDQTGIGRGVFDMFVEADLDPIGVTITGGAATSPAEEGGYHVSKIDLVSALERAIDEERLQFADDLPLREDFERELMAFRRKVKRETGYLSFGASGGDVHDDLVIAIALPVWLAEWKSRNKIEPLDPELAEMLLNYTGI